MISHKTATVDGPSIFYREAGTPGSPKLALLEISWIRSLSNIRRFYQQKVAHQ